jgi:tetratricopeptide (TPR) repeat protein
MKLFQLILSKLDFSGYARRCAERLCLSVRLFQCSLRLRLSTGGIAAGYFLMTSGKAQPFRTSGGTAAKLSNISKILIFVTFFSATVSAQQKDITNFLQESAALIQTGKFSDAEPILRKATAIAPQNSDAHNLLGIVFGELGKATEAEREYKTAIRLNPKAVSPRANLGVLLAKNKRQTEAIQNFEAVLKLNPNHPQTIVNLGLLYSSINNLPRAIEFLQKANQIQPDDYNILFKLGSALYQTKKLEEAKNAFTSANLISPTSVEPVYFLGLIVFDQSNYDLAAQYFENALNLKPDFADADFMLGEVFAKQKRYAEAIVFYEKAIAQDKTKPVYFVRLGGTYLLNYETPKAFQYFKEAAALFPNDAEIKYFFAIAARSSGEYDLAFSEAKKALILKETADTNALLGSMLVDRNDYPEAEKYLRKAVSLNPNHFNSQHDLGRILVKQQKFAEALPILQRAASLMPNVADVHYQLFLTYTRLRRKAEADKEFELFKQFSNK